MFIVGSQHLPYTSRRAMLQYHALYMSHQDVPKESLGRSDTRKLQSHRPIFDRHALSRLAVYTAPTFVELGLLPTR